MAALILVDLQADFLSPTKDQPALIDSQPFRKLLPALLREFTTRRRPIIWVKSEYPQASPDLSRPFPSPEPPEEFQKFEAYLSKTHSGSRVCKPTSPGAAFDPAIASLKHPHHTEVVKSFYSAFTETSIQEILKSSGSKDLFIAGVTANTCVAATAVHARRLGYSVTLLSDLIKSVKQETQDRAIQTLTNPHYNISLCTSDKVSTVLESHPALPTLYYVNGSIPSWRVMISLAQKEIPYIAKRLRVMTTPKETRSAEFAAINPRCKTPTFIDVDGTVVIESLAILQYLEQFYPNPALFPDASDKGSWTKALVRFHESENPHNLYELIELLYLPNWADHKWAIVQAYHDTMSELVFWEGYLSDGGLLSEREEMGLADCAFYPILAYMVHRGLDLEGFPGLKAYYARCVGLRAVIEACPTGWEEPGKTSLFAKCERLLEEEAQGEFRA